MLQFTVYLYKLRERSVRSRYELDAHSVSAARFAAFHRIANCHVRNCVATVSSHMGCVRALRARCELDAISGRARRDLWASSARSLGELGAISGRAHRERGAISYVFDRIANSPRVRNWVYCEPAHELHALSASSPHSLCELAAHSRRAHRALWASSPRTLGELGTHSWRTRHELVANSQIVLLRTRICCFCALPANSSRVRRFCKGKQHSGPESSGPE